MGRLAMPSFRCPKCRNRLTADGSLPTVTCGQCGQICAIPKLPPAPAAITKTPAPPPLPPTSPAPPAQDGVLRMEDIMAGGNDDDAVDVVEAGDDEEVLDV